MKKESIMENTFIFISLNILTIHSYKSHPNLRLCGNLKGSTNSNGHSSFVPCSNTFKLPFSLPLEMEQNLIHHKLANRRNAPGLSSQCVACA